MTRALVTGASRGLGRALAETLHDRGSEVVATARREADLDELDVAARFALASTPRRRRRSSGSAKHCTSKHSTSGST
jgi:NAD(P)-dependent dehydrogenase (short-subunit alcohol dehydrogenase family)